MDKFKMTDESKTFIKELFDFLTKRNVQNLKIPQIGGSELNLCELYKAVCKRGGYQRVCNNKMWKDIVIEFGLPRTCTSASYTLRNHYQKYLLAYESKFFFGKEVEPVVEDQPPQQPLPGSKPRKLVKTEDDYRPAQSSHSHQHSHSSHSHSHSHSHPEIPPKAATLEALITNMYVNMPDNAEMRVIKKYKMMPVVSEMNRIMLAFESKLPEELTYALNSLLMYSVNNNFNLEQNSQLLDNFVTYIEDVLKEIPYFKKIYFKLNKDAKLDAFENKNYSISDVMQNCSEGPIKKLEEIQSLGVTSFYQSVSEVNILENIRTIFHIIRNFSFTKANVTLIYKHEKLYKLALEFFIEGIDGEIVRDCLDIISNTSQHLSLKNVPEPDKFMERMKFFLSSENTDELESSLECLKNLVLLQENENTIESHLESYIDQLVDLMINPKPDVRDSVLEFLIFLSDLKMATKVLVAKHPKAILRLVGMLVGGTGKTSDKVTKLSALILSNLSNAPAAKQFFVPYERDLFIVAASDPAVSKILCSILYELGNVTWNPKLI